MLALYMQDLRVYHRSLNLLVPAPKVWNDVRPLSDFVHSVLQTALGIQLGFLYGCKVSIYRYRDSQRHFTSSSEENVSEFDLYLVSNITNVVSRDPLYKPKMSIV